MKKNRLILILILLGGLLGTGVLALFAYVSFQLRDVKAPLLSFLKNQIDGDLQIADADVSLFPAGINLKGVKLYAPGETTPSATIEKAKLRFNLLPLIQKKIETRVFIYEPDIRLTRGKDGRSNMERIFSPLMAGEKKKEISPEAEAMERLWWKRLAVNKLLIEKAHFISIPQKTGKAPTELKNVSIEADEIRFEAGQAPAKIKIRYDLPQISKEPMELRLRLAFQEATQGLQVQEGKFGWGPLAMDLSGEALLPTLARKDVLLNLNFLSPTVDLKKLSKIMTDPLPVSGILSLKGTVTGTAFDPLLKLILDSPSLTVAGKTLANFHAELTKKDKAVQIDKASFGIYGGSVALSGVALPSETTSVNLDVSLRSISLAAAAGSKSPASLSGTLQVASGNIKNPNSFSGGGRISLGPIPLPVVNLQNKIKVGEIVTAGTGANRLVNLGMLSSSANLIGTSIPQINATIKFAGRNVTMSPFSLGNGHFKASGSGAIANQKSIAASGTATLNPSVTAQLFPDPLFRSAVTGGKGGLSVPFTLSGPLDNPDFNIDSGYMSSLIARAAATALPKLLMGGVQPQQMLGAALKNTPLADPKNPLSQILGTAPPRQTTAPTQQSAPQRRQTTSTQQPKTLGDLLFGR